MTEHFHDDIFDLIIIGAGINGAGVARDAAMRGLKVLLLDKSDLCAGTSAWSTRLIHGGLRYLEHAEFGLVRESLRERETLLRIAPHLIKPLPILLPVYDRQSRGPWTIRAGMLVYDLLSFDKSLPRHRMMSAAQIEKYAPELNGQGLRAAFLYYDAQVEFAERLVLENVLSAVEHGAIVRTYAEVDYVGGQDANVLRVKFTDRITGERHEVAGRLVINAAGPWIDQVLAKNALAGASPLIGGTKGSHLVVAPFTATPLTAVYVEAEQDQRPIFVIPWNGNYLIGTTDIRYSGSLDLIKIDHQEIDYLLSEVNRLIPSAQLGRESILFSYSGVRPLALSEHGDERGITRRHFIREHQQLDGLMSLVGGKLSTYRSLAQQTVDLCLLRLKKEARKCITGTTPLPGAVSSIERFLEESGREFSPPPATSERLWRVYGSRGIDVLNLTREKPQLLDVFDETGAIAAEVVFAFEKEMARTLSDCLLRRTMVGLNSSCGLNAVEAAADIAQRELGWTESRAREEIRNYRSYVQRFTLKNA